jgi:MFS family permease
VPEPVGETKEPPGALSDRRGAGSAWAPLHHPMFAAMSAAAFISNVGSWMQTVGAQWLMLTLTGSAAYVALVQSAASVPIFLFAVLAGTIGDLVDRRRFLIVAQSYMFAVAALLGVLTILKLVSPWSLLALIFGVGIGQALTSPTWQTLQPELVDPEERTQAISLGSVNQNLARAVGPAIGGAVLTATSAGVLFLINAATFGPLIAVIARWRAKRAPSALPREHVREAVRAGGRYVRASPALRVVLLRCGLFSFFASSIWAVLPLIAQKTYHLGSGGYGLLLGCVGVGAVVGASLLPRLRKRFSPAALLLESSAVLAVVSILLGFVHVTAIAALALAGAGSAWILALSTLNSLYQLMLPQWVKTRGMSFYLVVFQGGTAAGSALAGLLAEHAGLPATMAITAGGLMIGPLAGLRYRLHPIAPDELMPSGDWAPPVLVGPEAPGGPVQVTVEYFALAGHEDELMAVLEETRFSRRRTGASAWLLWRDSAEPSRILEQFVVVSWEEHLRQHGRSTVRDQARIDHARSLTDPARPTTVTHWLAAPLAGK